VTTYKNIRNLSACVEKRGRVRIGGWLQFGRGELGWGRRRGRRRRNRGRESRRVGIYWLLPMQSPTETFRRYTRQ
jgi:hypothetical protein